MALKRKPPTRPRRVRYSETSWALIVAAAGEAGTPPSTFIRAASVREARRRLACEVDLAGASDPKAPRSTARDSEVSR